VAYLIAKEVDRMGTNPAQQAGRITHRVVSLVAGVALAVLMVQHSAARKAAQRRADAE
jgi:hypothetical protein